MFRIYEVDPKKSLHDIMFDAWEQHPIVFINGIPYRTLLMTLAYDFENDIYEIYKKSDSCGPHSTQGGTLFYYYIKHLFYLSITNIIVKQVHCLRL